MKAIVELGRRGAAIGRARAQLANARAGKNADYHLVFESIKTLFSELTPARIDTLKHLRAMGHVSIYQLAKTMHRNYSNVHRDVEKLIEHRLVEKDPDDLVFSPWDSVEIRVDLAQAA